MTKLLTYYFWLLLASTICAQDYTSYLPGASGPMPQAVASVRVLPKNTNAPPPEVTAFELTWSNMPNGVYEILSSSFLSQPFALLETLTTNECVVSNSFPSQFFAAFLLSPYSIALTWSPSVSPNVTGYDICYGGKSGIYTNEVLVGNVTNLTIGGLAGGCTYYFAAAAVDSQGFRSALSAQLTDDIPMLAVSGLKISPLN